MVEENSRDQSQQDSTQTAKPDPQPLPQALAASHDAPVIKEGLLPNQSSGQTTDAQTRKEIQEAAEVAEKELEPFERQIVRLTAIGIIVAVVTGTIFYVQLKDMGYQTQILAGQGESASAGALFDQIDTRNQYQIAVHQPTS